MNKNYEAAITNIVDEIIAIKAALDNCEAIKAYAIKLDFNGDLHKLSVEDIEAAFELLHETEGPCWYADEMFGQYMLAW